MQWNVHEENIIQNVHEITQILTLTFDLVTDLALNPSVIGRGSGLWTDWSLTWRSSALRLRVTTTVNSSWQTFLTGAFEQRRPTEPKQHSHRKRALNFWFFDTALLLCWTQPNLHPNLSRQPERGSSTSILHTRLSRSYRRNITGKKGNVFFVIKHSNRKWKEIPGSASQTVYKNGRSYWIRKVKPKIHVWSLHSVYWPAEGDSMRKWLYF